VLPHHLRCKLTGNLAHQPPIESRVGTARRRRPTPVAKAPLYPRSGAGAPEVGDADGAASLPIFTKVLPYHLRCKLTGNLAHQPPIESRVGTARRRRPTHVAKAPLYPRSGAGAPEVGDTDGAASLPIITKVLPHHLRDLKLKS